MFRVLCLVACSSLMAGCSFSSPEEGAGQFLVFHVPVHRQDAPTADNATGYLPDHLRVPGHPGLMISPYAPERGYVDVRGFKSGDLVRDPYTGQTFYVP